MKRFFLATFILTFFALVGGSNAGLYGSTPGEVCAPNLFGSSSGEKIYQDSNNPNGTWSGSKADLVAIVAQAKAKYGIFEDDKHLGRNATMLVPATLDEMKREIALGNTRQWGEERGNGAHGSLAKSDDGLVMMGIKTGINWVEQFVEADSAIIKYTNQYGDEVVYSLKTGRIVPNEKLGTKNFGGSGFICGSHRQQDMDPHTTKADPKDPYSRDGDQYKYVGILYERDPDNPDKFYLVDGQTGKRMTKRQAKDFPTTLSDMWREQGLVCVSNDANDVPDSIPAMDYCVQEMVGVQGKVVIDSMVDAGNTVIDNVTDWIYQKTDDYDPSAVNVPVTGRSSASMAETPASASAQAYETIDYRPVKNWATATIHDAYSRATGIADSEGFGAEYRSRVSPIVNQGLNYIQSMPDQVQVPVGQ